MRSFSAAGFARYPRGMRQYSTWRRPFSSELLLRSCLKSYLFPQRGFRPFPHRSELVFPESDLRIAPRWIRPFPRIGIPNSRRCHRLVVHIFRPGFRKGFASSPNVLPHFLNRFFLDVEILRCYIRRWIRPFPRDIRPFSAERRLRSFCGGICSFHQTDSPISPVAPPFLQTASPICTDLMARNL